jgi:hypothetical protein
MHELADKFRSLSPDQKRIIHLNLCEHALTKWQAFASSRRWIMYADSVCGTKQAVDKSLPLDALQSARDGRDVADVDARYAEPITALHDDDLNLPASVEYAYYAIYNTFSKYARKENVDDWLIVNQALASETDESRWPILLEAAMRKAV